MGRWSVKTVCMGAGGRQGRCRPAVQALRWLARQLCRLYLPPGHCSTSRSPTSHGAVPAQFPQQHAPSANGGGDCSNPSPSLPVSGGDGGLCAQLLCDADRLLPRAQQPDLLLSDHIQRDVLEHLQGGAGGSRGGEEGGAASLCVRKRVCMCGMWASGAVAEWDARQASRQAQAGRCIGIMSAGIPGRQPPGPGRRTLSWKREARHRNPSSTPPDLTRSITCRHQPARARSSSSGGAARGQWAGSVESASCQLGKLPLA